MEHTFKGVMEHIRGGKVQHTAPIGKPTFRNITQLIPEASATAAYVCSLQLWKLFDYGAVAGLA